MVVQTGGSCPTPRLEGCEAEADRTLDDSKSKAACIQKRAQAALALAENIAEGRRLIDPLRG